MSTGFVWAIYLGACAFYLWFEFAFWIYNSQIKLTSIFWKITCKQGHYLKKKKNQNLKTKMKKKENDGTDYPATDEWL